MDMIFNLDQCQKDDLKNMLNNIIFDKNKLTSPQDTLMIGFFLGHLSSQKFQISTKFLNDVIYHTYKKIFKVKREIRILRTKVFSIDDFIDSFLKVLNKIMNTSNSDSTEVKNLNHNDSLDINQNNKKNQSSIIKDTKQNKDKRKEEIDKLNSEYVQL